MAYRHGVYVSEVPTSLVPPVQSDASLPVVVGTAPVNLLDDPSAAVNKPILAYSYAEAVEALGFVPAKNGKFAYSLCEFIKSQFALFAAGPVVLINVLDPADHKVDETDEELAVVAGRVTLPEGTLRASVVVKAQGGTPTYTEGTDYELTLNEDGSVNIVALSGGTMPTTGSVLVTYSAIDPTAVDANDVIGGVDALTGKATGLELVNEVFPRFRLVPGQILAPGFSTDPTVAAVMKAKAANINGHFRAISLVDIPTDSVAQYSDAPAWKNTNNIVDPLEVACWPMLRFGDELHHLSTQLAGLICRTDAANDGIPYVSPSNKNLQAMATVLEDGTEVFLGPDSAAYLNGEGIVTGLNFIGGWKAWGNRTAAYPSITDPKDSFLPVRRMMNWIGNTLILTFWQKVDDPLNRRQIDTVVDSANVWLNGLAARGAIIGGRVEFLESENPITDLMDGIARFHVYVTPPSPNREIDFVLEYDPSYLAGLFG